MRTRFAEYIENVRRVLGAIRGERSLFITSFLVSEERTGVAPVTFDERMPEALEIASRLGYDVWDLYAETRSSTAAFWADDRLHFNAAGHEKIARRVLRWIEETGQPDERQPG